MRQVIIGLGIVVALTLGVMTAAAQVMPRDAPQHVISADSPITLGLVWVVAASVCQFAASIVAQRVTIAQLRGALEKDETGNAAEHTAIKDRLTHVEQQQYDCIQRQLEEKTSPGR